MKERVNKENPLYKVDRRPVSVLPSITKIFKKLMQKHISNYLSPYLRGYRKGFSSQQAQQALITCQLVNKL